MTSFKLSCFFRGPISKYGHTGGQALYVWGDTDTQSVARRPAAFKLGDERTSLSVDVASPTLEFLVSVLLVTAHLAGRSWVCMWAGSSVIHTAVLSAPPCGCRNLGRNWMQAAGGASRDGSRTGRHHVEVKPEDSRHTGLNTANPAASGAQGRGMRCGGSGGCAVGGNSWLVSI